MIRATVWLDVPEREATLLDVSAAFATIIQDWTIEGAVFHRIEVEKEDA